jgi:hypothetical protein
MSHKTPLTSHKSQQLQITNTFLSTMASHQSQCTPPSTNPDFNPEPEITVDDGIVEQPNSTQNNNNNNNNNENPHTRRQLRGAAVAGGLTGFLLGGPIIAAVAAGGAVLAVTSKGKAGEVVRSTGELTASAGDRLKKVDQKHHVVEKTTKGFSKSCNWAAKKMKPRNQQPPTTSA